jgi:hypothetical protein
LRKGDIGGALDDIEWRDLLPGASVPRCDGYPGMEDLGCVGLGGAVSTWSVCYILIFFLLRNHGGTRLIFLWAGCWLFHLFSDILYIIFLYFCAYNNYQYSIWSVHRSAYHEVFREIIKISFLFSQVSSLILLVTCASKEKG